MSKYTDVDALIEDLRYDIELDARTLDDLYFADANERELVQLDKDIKQNTIDILEHAQHVDEEKIAIEYCKKKGLVMITMDSWEKVIAYENRDTVL